MSQIRPLHALFVLALLALFGLGTLGCDDDDYSADAKLSDMAVKG